MEFNVDMVRERMTQFVIQESLPFNHFDNPRLTKMIQEMFQPSYTHVSRTTLRRHCLNMWKDAKKQIILEFENLNNDILKLYDLHRYMKVEASLESSLSTAGCQSG